MFEILLKHPEGCVRGELVQRVKRFSIEFVKDGRTFWAHTNNSGSMAGLVNPGAPVFVSPALGKDRKLPFTLEMIGLKDMWVGVNTMTPNRLLRAAFLRGLLPWAAGYTEYRAEVRHGLSRMDALLTGPGLPRLWVECKNVTLVREGMAAFPDAVSVRGQKHLKEMAGLVKKGERAAFFYCVQRSDASSFGPAYFIDGVYAELFYSARALGVESYAHHVPVSPEGIGMGGQLPIIGL